MGTTLYLLSSPTNAKLLSEGIAELDAGNGVGHGTLSINHRTGRIEHT